MSAYAQCPKGADSLTAAGGGRLRMALADAPVEGRDGRVRPPRLNRLLRGRQPPQHIRRRDLDRRLARTRARVGRRGGPNPEGLALRPLFALRGAPERGGG